MQSSKQIKNISAYISPFPNEVRIKLKKIRELVRKIAPQAKEAIKYQMPTFVLNGNLIHFAAFKNHIGFYPTPSGISAFRKELAPYVTAKGSIQFPLNKELPLALIKKIVEYRMKETLSKIKKKQK